MKQFWIFLLLAGIICFGIHCQRGEKLSAQDRTIALGAIEAIAAAGKTGEIIVVGFDAINDARQAIRARRMNASIAQHPFEMGKQDVERAYQVLQGDTIPKNIPVKIELITIENVE